MNPPRGNNKRIGPTKRFWKHNQRSDHILLGKAHALTLFVLPFLYNSEEVEYHHQDNRRNHKGDHHRQQLLKFGGIKFLLINLPVERRWQIKDMIKSQGTMVGGANIIEVKGPGASNATIASHECRYNDPWSGIATKWWISLMKLIMWRLVPKSIKTLVETPLIGLW